MTIAGSTTVTSSAVSRFVDAERGSVAFTRPPAFVSDPGAMGDCVGTCSLACALLDDFMALPAMA
ncbi:hypothetical protein GCM10010211_15670 [Streptomyces albospinus]|uniref:Uncharacterized protein n=1 Tax=Streptomyces albospinus TaxID=285515 RepID=A0ABQ2USW0_9ACTN|nr:hypothetical protein GCM10010211_15670 [Streptomyces albospinus]